MLKFTYLFIFLAAVTFVNCQNQPIKFRARDVKTFVFFTFDNSTKDFDSQTIISYIDYFTELVNIWDVSDIYEFENLPVELFFGKFNSTVLLHAANDENNTLAIIILKNNQEFIDNITVEAVDPFLNANAKCNSDASTNPQICKSIEHFVNGGNNPLTKLNFVVFSNICPDSSILKPLDAYGSEQIPSVITTNSIMVSKTNEICKGFKNQIKIRNTSSANLEDIKILVDPTFDSPQSVDKYLFLLVKNENYQNSIIFLIEYYNGFCSDSNNNKSTYFVTMRRYMNNEYSKYQEITTAIPFVEFGANAEEYFKQNFDYHFRNSAIITSEPNTLELDSYVRKDQFTSPYPHIILFSDRYFEGINNELFYAPAENRTFDFILFNTAAGDKETKSFYQKKDSSNYLSHFYLIPDSNSWDKCYFIPRLEDILPWYLWAGIAAGGVAIFVAVLTFYFKCIKKRKNPLYIIVNHYQQDDKKDFKEECDKLCVDKDYVKLDFNTVEGRGNSSTVYRSEVKRRALSTLPRKSMDKNASEEEHIAAAKLLTRLEKEEIDEVTGEIKAAKKLEQHENICILLGVTTFQEAPCLLYEWMEMSLLGYIKSLRVDVDDAISIPSTYALSAVEDVEHYIVPDFDEKQERIFMQILLQVTRGLDHIASKNLVHRDVAARNILISHYGDTFTAKVADFGLCVDIDEDSNVYRASLNKRLPVKWLALECHTDRTFSQASDVWAFGVTMIEVYSLAGVLYPGIKMNEIPEYLQNGGRLERPEKMPDKVYEIAFNCWNANPYLRPMFSELTNTIEKLLRENDPYSFDNHGYWYVEDEEWQTIPLTNDSV